MHRKRHATPNKWVMGRKVETWAPSGEPGPHSSDSAVPLNVVLRDLLGVAESAREAKRAISEGRIEVDGVIRRDERYPVGLFDVLSLGNRDYRMLIEMKNRFELREIGDPGLKPAKVLDATVRGGDRQMNLSGGYNLNGDAPTGSTLILGLPEKAIEKVLEMESGNLAFVTGGKHAGQLARLEEYEVVRSSSPNRVYLERDGEVFGTVEDYVMVIGEEEPEVEL